MANALDSAHWFRDFIKIGLMSHLGEHVVALGVCPRCHAKTLRGVHKALDVTFEQCTKCKTIYVQSVQP